MSRRRIPDEIKARQGTLRKDRAGSFEHGLVMRLKSVPMPPKRMSKDAAVLWREWHRT